ncbi:formyltetrahydrofolate deformylase [Buchananella hordeovulneris]|uniref:Formyltetrahydrofolate deformylase n=1 Tax=Buchananella hordeovulneris TaxID=52770 RepID=A0A1Q5PZ53_9ACTO|nr:formyltetrahydrofolate deformylase [Buchananella hordeovulneris]MDO5080774.1 formyltetrahydrofolate deformylase [Buchananella hordeovulneris]OKL52817.1 formyltetrahydrofolate deformylase [Buchananella hordeovulneris]RRD52853.1 formyltetrahydrofolate deformylase [Buchananella hordeovulneris]
MTSAAAPELILTLSCPDRPGIVHAVTGLIAGYGGNVVQSQQFGDHETGQFFMRVHLAGASREAMEGGMMGLAERFGMQYQVNELGRPLRTIIMVSKDGHCLTDLLFRHRSQGLAIEPVAVVGNHTDLQPIAEFYGVPFHHVPVTRETKPQAEQQLLDLVAATEAELVVLARYMQILSDRVCEELAGNVINIHHSFLPSFKGARPYAQAHERGVKIIGATAHYVTADLDEGPIIEQDVARVTHADDVASLVAIGQDVERRVLAQAVKWHCDHRVLLNGSRTVVFA